MLVKFLSTQKKEKQIYIQITVDWLSQPWLRLKLLFIFLPSPAPALLTSTTWPWTRWGRFSTCRTPPVAGFTACGTSASPKIRLAIWKWWPAPASSVSPSTRATAARAGRPRRLRSTTREVWGIFLSGWFWVVDKRFAHLKRSRFCISETGD